jgi:class 3 adenylate cyclase
MNSTTTIGRLSSSDIVIESGLVSRRHAKLVVDASGVTVHDLDSHNGIFLNGRKVRSTSVNPGDLLYIGDVCVMLRPAPDLSDSVPVRHDSGSEAVDEPADRNLLALVRATSLLQVHEDHSFFMDLVDVCRDLTEATVAVMFRVGDEGALETPVALHPESGRRGGPPVSWEVVNACLASGHPMFSRDVRERPLVANAAPVHDAGAILCAPILVGARCLGALYFSRAAAGAGFTERELTTVMACAQLCAQRLLAPERVERTERFKLEPQTDPTRAPAGVQLGEAAIPVVQADASVLSSGETPPLIELPAPEDAEERAALEARVAALEHEVTRWQEASARDADEKRALHEARESVERALDEERRSARAELDELRDRARQLEEEAQRAEAEVDTSRDTGEGEPTMVHADGDAARLAALLEHMRKSLPLPVVEHLEQQLSRVPTTPDQPQPVSMEAPVPVARTITALFVSLSGVDGFALRAQPLEAKARLDRFCTAVLARVRANGGVVEQVLGHAHLATFGGDSGAARSALRCALEVAALVPTDGTGGVQVGVHTGSAISGFFGEEHASSFVEVGDAIAIARGTADYAQPGTVYATDAVRVVLGADPTLALIGAGPHLVRGMTAPVNLFMVGRASADDGAEAS